MAHEQNIQTQLVARIWRAPAGTDIPSPVNYGESLTLTAPWEANGWRFSEDDFSVTQIDPNPITVHPPDLPMPIGQIREYSGIESFTLPTYETGHKLYEWITNAVIDSGEHRETTTHDRVAIIIEVQGVGFHYFPSCEIDKEITSLGRRTLAHDNLTVRPFGTDEEPTGHVWVEYTAGSYS